MMAWLLNISPVHCQTTHRVRLERTCTATGGLDAETFSWLPTRGGAFSLDILFIEPNVRRSQERLRKLTPSAAGAPF